MLDKSKVKKEVILPLIADSWCVVDNLLPLSFAESILKHLNIRNDQEAFQSARIGSAGHLQTNSTLRGDKTLWLDESLLSRDSGELNDEQKTEFEILKTLTKFRDIFKEELLMSLTQIDVHYAIYPPGHGYKTHYDRKGHNNTRELTFILYLNQNWEKIDGGELVLFDKNTSEDTDENKGSVFQIVEPYFNRMVFFKSQMFPHQVKPSTKHRKSLTGWFKSESNKF